MTIQGLTESGLALTTMKAVKAEVRQMIKRFGRPGPPIRKQAQQAQKPPN